MALMPKCDINLYFVHLIPWVGYAQFPYIYYTQHRVDHTCLKDHCSSHPFICCAFSTYILILIIAYLDRIRSHLYNACLDRSSNIVFFYGIILQVALCIYFTCPHGSLEFGQGDITQPV